MLFGDAKDNISDYRQGRQTKTYHLLPLPADLVQKVETVPTGFYTELMVGGAAGKAYYYNPHFAKTALAANAGAPELVSIRTARQLYALSEYYDKYADEKVLHKDAAFQQERDIDYGSLWLGRSTARAGKWSRSRLPSDRQKTLPLSTAMTAAAISSPAFPLPAGRTAMPSACSALQTGTLENIVVTTDQELARCPHVQIGRQCPVENGVYRRIGR